MPTEKLTTDQPTGTATPAVLAAPPTHKPLTSPLERLEAENKALREKLALAGIDVSMVPGPPAAAVRPSFGLSAGEASDLRDNGVTVSPFTGELLTATGEGIPADELTGRAKLRDAAATKD